MTARPATRTAPPLEELEHLVLKGLGPRKGPENLRRLHERTLQSAGDPDQLLLQAKLYWFVARLLDEDTMGRLEDLLKAVSEQTQLRASRALTLEDEDAVALIELLKGRKLRDNEAGVWWSTEKLLPDQISPGPLLFFSQYTKKSPRLRPVLQVFNTFNSTHPATLRKRSPQLYP